MSRSQTIYVFIGTKAQYIKTAPLLRLMQDRGIHYHLINSGQHAEFTKALRIELGIGEPDASLASKGNIKTVREAFIWFMRYVAIALFKPKFMKRRFFNVGPGICIIHGDTPSTLLALIMAKRAKLKIAHIEAGLRSHNLLRPFPEELVRIICMRFSDYLYAPSDWAYENIMRMGVKGKVLNVRQNTNVEALYYALGSTNSPVRKMDSPYCLITIHRTETILNRRRLTFVVELAELLTEKIQVVFVLHDPTRRQLEEYGLIGRIIDNSQIGATGLIDHAAFLAYLANADFVITDGGSIQEESYYLDVPCLVMRKETERMDGLGENVQLAEFDLSVINSFLENYPSLRRGAKTKNLHPSSEILRSLLEEV